MKIRKATKQDMPQVLELIKELAIFENEPDAVEINVAHLEREGFGENPLFTCFVADTASAPNAKDEIVGAALVYYRFSTWKGRTLHLEDLIVKESERGKGIGEALYKQVMQFAQEHNLKRVAWDVLNWNTGAIRFYERSGATIMKEWRVVHMDEQSLQNYLNF
ncbi:GNAT family N-acetyltransferase [Aequorivita sp. F47161]|uniref:GNAT family N-acetyltransferase n=1 Tax=Aequorivita vitellina TaxID=2874475 RepID=A0A9X1U8G9_9FLAO|nr:GNAT family N-acetyltransferase [Aequorivita vitellina]MCG2417426.1 GNAT family N-acetyltransferase [Aequorivita vitellina]MCZ4318320.1 GNAT family N-acetyltransferase [Aequorivita viscosa]